MKKQINILSAIPIPVKLLVFVPLIYFGLTLMFKYMGYFGDGNHDMIGFLFSVIIFIAIASGLLFFSLKNTHKVRYWICIIVSTTASILSFWLSTAVLLSTTTQKFFTGTDFWFCVFEYDNEFNDIGPTDTAFQLFISLCYYLLLVLFWIVVKNKNK